MTSPDVNADALQTRVREICLALPGAQERISHGSPNWYTTKTFCWWGAHVGKADAAADRLPADALATGISFLPDADEREALLASGRFFIPGYIGHRGWLAMDLTGRHSGRVDWAEVAELIEESYRLTAGKRLIAQLNRA